MRGRIPIAALFAVCAALSCESTEVVEPPDSGFPTLSIVAGQDQVGHPGEELPEPLVVQAVEIVDGKETPVAGVVVNFVVTAGGGSVFAGAASTDKEGYAADYLTLGLDYTNKVEVRSVDTNGQKHVWGTFTARAKDDATPPYADVWFWCRDPENPQWPAEDCPSEFYPGDEYVLRVWAIDPHDPVSDLSTISCEFQATVDGQTYWFAAVLTCDNEGYGGEAASFEGMSDPFIIPAGYKGGETIYASATAFDGDGNSTTAEAQLTVSKPK